MRKPLLSRREFTVSSAASFALPATARADSWTLSECEGSCFNSDFPALGYETLFWSVFDLAGQGKLSPTSSGRPIRSEMVSLFEGERLYQVKNSSIAVEWRNRLDGFDLARIQFDLECGVPVVGCLGIPHSRPEGLVLLAHGISSLPERCFTYDQPDYMNGIAKRLCEDGFAVWAPFIFQSGNQWGQNTMAAMLLSKGISLHNVLCSSLEAGEFISRNIANLTNVKVGCYGVSWGSIVALHLEAATTARRPTVASGYLRDEGEFLSSANLLMSVPFELATYIHFNPNSFKFPGSDLASLLRPTPLCFEVGTEDRWNSNIYGRDRAFEEMRQRYASTGHTDQISINMFEGGHEAHGIEARKWLFARLAI